MKPIKLSRSFYSSNGTVLFIVMVFILAVTSIVLISHLHFTAEMDFVQDEFDKLKAYACCFSGAQFALNRYLSSTRNRIELLDYFKKRYYPRLLLDGSDISMGFLDIVREAYFDYIPLDIVRQMEEFDITLCLQDSAGLINFFKIRKDLLKNFLGSYEVDRDRSQVLIDSIYDWMDADDFSRQRGAEKDFYGERSTDIPPNRLIYSQDELLLIRGMEGHIYEKVKDVIDFTIQNHGLNPNTMPRKVFRLFPGLSESRVSDIIKMRKFKEFETLSALTLRSNYNFSVYPQTFQFFTSEIVYATISAKMKDNRAFFLRLKVSRGSGERHRRRGEFAGGLRDRQQGSGKGLLGETFFIQSWIEGTVGNQDE